MKNPSLTQSAPFNENQIRAKQYLDKHNIQDIITDMINTITHYQVSDPIVFMIQFLCCNHSTETELYANGITFQEDKMKVQPVLCIPFPTFSTNYKGLFKSTLTRENFSQCKNKITKSQNDLRKTLKVSLEYPLCSEGLFLLDPESYKVYEPIVRPLLQANCKSTNSIVYRKDDSFGSNYAFLNPIRDLIEECRIKMKRNLNQYGYVASMNPRFRSEIQSRIEIFLEKSLKMQVFQISSLSNDQAKKLLQVNDRIFIKKEKGQTDMISILGSLKKGLRYPDWPCNRSIALTSEKNTLVWVNKEDHLDFRTYATKGNSVEQVLQKASEFSDCLEKELRCEHSSEFGYLCVKPRDSGLGVNFQLKLKLNQNSSKLKQNINNFKKQQTQSMFFIRESKDKCFTLQVSKSARMNYSDFPIHLNIALMEIFDGVVTMDQPDVQTVRKQSETRNPSPKNFDFGNNHIAINIEQQQEQEMEIEEPSISPAKIYSQLKLQEIPEPQFPFKPLQLVESLNDDVIYHKNEFIKEKYAIARRNLQYPQTRQDTVELIKQFLGQCTIETQKQQDVLGWLQTKQIIRDSQAQIPDEVTKITSLDPSITVICFLDDDYTFVHNITHFSVSQSLYALALILNRFEIFLKLNNQVMLEHPNLGYLCKKPQYCGNGIGLMFVTKGVLVSNSEYLSDDGSCLILELPQITQESLKKFCVQLNVLMLTPKEKWGSQNQFTESQSNGKPVNLLLYRTQDLYSENKANLGAIEIETFYHQQNIYSTYLKIVDVYYQEFKSKLGDERNSEVLDDLLFKNYISTPILQFPERLHAKINVSIYRNLNKNKFCRQMSFYELKQLKLKLRPLLEKQGLQLHKESSQGDHFKSSPNQMDLICCGTHHIEIRFNSSVKQLSQKMMRAQELLESIKTLHDFSKKQQLIKQFSSQYGYLGPNIIENIFSGVQINIKLKVKAHELKQLEQFCSSYKYVINERTKRSNQMYKIYESLDEEEPLLKDNDEQNLKKMIACDRPQFLPIEYRFINELGKLLHK